MVIYYLCWSSILFLICFFLFEVWTSCIFCHILFCFQCSALLLLLFFSFFSIFLFACLFIPRLFASSSCTFYYLFIEPKEVTLSMEHRNVIKIEPVAINCRVRPLMTKHWDNKFALVYNVPITKTVHPKNFEKSQITSEWDAFLWNE